MPEKVTHEVLLGMGANLGDPAVQLARAVRLMSWVVRVDAVSSVYRSAPVGFADQPDFFNVVVRGRTAVEPGALLRVAQRAEAELGRERSFADAPRTIDIDLLACGDVVMRTEELTLPHPRLHLRGFVLHPLVEVAAEWVHPVLHRTAQGLLASAGELERVERLGPLPGDGGEWAVPPAG